MRIVRGDNRATVLVAARVVGDTLVGQRSPRGSRVAAPLGDIRRLELATVDGARTAALVLAVVAGLVIAIAVGASKAQPGLGDTPIF